MTTWIKPAVGWGIIYNGKLCRYYCPLKADTRLQTGESLEKVALVPLAVARKTGLLKKPKERMMVRRELPFDGSCGSKAGRGY